MSIAMKIIVLTIVLLFQQFLSSFSFAQGEAALPFLEIPTNAEMNGMGYASVAHITDNPAALTTNPAHLGLQCLNNSIFTAGANYSNWLPSFHLDLWTRTITTTAGLNLNKIYLQLPSLSVGISYSNVYMNFGEFVRTGPDSPDIITTFNSHDESNQVTLSIAADYFVRASIGITYKHITSTLSDQPTAGDPGNGSATANLYDLGFLVDVPVVTLISKIIDKPISVYDKISPLFNFSLGISKSNLGQESIYYIDPAQGDPLPRLAHAGIGLAFGLQYDQKDISWIPFSFKWTVEANDLCVTTNSSGNSVYQPGLGDIDFLKEIILGKTKKETDQLKGWELNLAETVYIYGGRFLEDPDHGNRNFTTDGYAVSFSGLLKTLAVIKPDLFENNFMKFVLNHIGLKFNQSTVNTPASILNDTQFYSLNISFNNWL
jgi:hypothetical protein